MRQRLFNLLFIALLSVSFLRLALADEQVSETEAGGVHIKIQEVFAIPHSNESKIFLSIQSPKSKSVRVDPEIVVYDEKGKFRTERMKDFSVRDSHDAILNQNQNFQTATVEAKVPNNALSIKLWMIDEMGEKSELQVQLDMPELTKLQSDLLITRYRGLNAEFVTGTSLDSISGHEDNSAKGFRADNHTFTGGLPQYQLRMRYAWRPLFYILTELFGRANPNTVGIDDPDQRPQSDVTVGIGLNLPPRNSLIFGKTFRAVRQLYFAVDDEVLPLLDFQSATASQLVNLNNLYMQMGAEFSFDSERRWFLRSHLQFGYMVYSSKFSPNFAFQLGARLTYAYMVTNEWYGGLEVGGYYRELDGKYNDAKVAYSYLSGNGLLVVGYHPLGVKSKL